MNAAAFLARALQEAKRYGGDPFVFLRELAQNARDAGAREIRVSTDDEAGRQRVTFADDGSGMTQSHGRAYLFRLYASSKEGDRQAAGHFGVGFWSVLGFGPGRILIESRTAPGPGRVDGERAWAVAIELDPAGVAGTVRVEHATCTLGSPGTRVTLERPSRGDDMQQLVRDGLHRYCRYLRRVPARARARLPVWLDGDRLDEPMRVDGPVSLRFETADADGVVGLGPVPRVELYARGLLVTTASFLEELEPGMRAPSHPEATPGLSPVVLINSDRLDVVLSRQAPVQGRVLRRVIRIGRARVRRLVQGVVDRACPRPWYERLADGAGATLQALGGGAAVVAFATWVVLLGGCLWLLWPQDPQAGDGRAESWGERVRQGVAAAAPWSGRPGSGADVDAAIAVTPTTAVRDPDGGGGRQGSGGPRPGEIFELEEDQSPGGHSGQRWAGRPGELIRPYENVTGYRGARVDVPETTAPPWGLTYTGGPSRLLFKTLTLDRYDLEHGLLHGNPHAGRPVPTFECHDRCVRVRLSLSPSDSATVLPVPTGYRVVGPSLRLDGRELWADGAEVSEAHLTTNDDGEVLLDGPGLAGTLSYVVGPGRWAPPAPPAPPTVDLPTALQPAPGEPPPTKDSEVHRQVRLTTADVAALLRYDVTPAAAARFAAQTGPWLARVMGAGAGDCDVKNGLNVLALRARGIPARMAVGIPAANGRAGVGLHAWTEYYAQRRWWPIDASGTPSADTLSWARSLRPPPVAAVLPAPARTLIDPVRAAPSRPNRAAPRDEAPEAAAKEPPRHATADPEPAVAESQAPPVVAAPRLALPAAPEAPERLGEAPRSQARRRTLALAAATVMGLVVLLGLGRGARVRERLQVDDTAGDQVELRALAGMITDALSHPKAWRTSDQLWRRRVLPTVRGRRMSVAEALERAARGALWLTRRRSPLALLAAAAGRPVLDGGDAIFAPVVAILGRGMDLDAVDALRPSTAPEPGLLPLLARGNELLYAAGVVCVVAPGLHQAPVMDVDLSRLDLPPQAGWPKRFIAVNPRSRSVRGRARLAQLDPRQATFVWIDWLLDRSSLLADHAPDLRREAARAALRPAASPPRRRR